MANLITDTNALTKGLVWVRLEYSDQSQFCFQTTLNTKLLRNMDITLEEGCLPRVDKKYYWDSDMVYRQFPYENAKITLWDDIYYSHEPSKGLHEFL